MRLLSTQWIRSSLQGKRPIEYVDKQSFPIIWVRG